MAIGLRDPDNKQNTNVTPGSVPIWEKPIFRKIVTGILILVVIECVIFLGGVVMAKNLGVF